MEHDSPHAPRQARRMPRVPPFYPVPTRTRRDGWTVQRQAAFVGMLAETGSVMGACEATGMSRKSAYALRARPGAESFAAAWDAALGAPVRKVTAPTVDFLAYHGLIRLVMFRGRYRGSSARPDDSALLRLVRRLDRVAARADTVSPEW
jgi:hypothetical protein